MRLVAAALLSVAIAIVQAGTARADDGPRFHRTSPRAALEAAEGLIVVGVPGGRAWGVESELRPLPAAGGTVIVRLSVDDPAVREAFVRVAYYASSPARSRQVGLSDSAAVAAGMRALVAVPLDPPPGAIAYRIRVLARLADASARSADDAVRARLRIANGADGRSGLLSRLLP